MNYYLKKTITVIALLVLSYISYNYYLYKKFFNASHLEELSNIWSTPVLNYLSEFKDADLTNPKAFNNMKQWVDKNYSINETSILEYGYAIKKHPGSGFYLFALYGEDSKSKASQHNFALKTIDGDNTFSSPIPSFFDYLLRSSDYDIVLFGYKPPK